MASPNVGDRGSPLMAGLLSGIMVTAAPAAMHQVTVSTLSRAFWDRRLSEDCRRKSTITPAAAQAKTIQWRPLRASKIRVAAVDSIPKVLGAMRCRPKAIAPPHAAPMTNMAHSLKMPGRKLTCMTTKPTKSPQLDGFSPMARAARAPERNWMPLVDDCRCTVSATDKLAHARSRLPHTLNPSFQLTGVKHAMDHNAISQANAESPRSTKWRLT